MEYALYFVKTVLSLMVNALSFAMLARVILSWFDPMQEWGISGFLHVVTEPIIMPIRVLFDRMHWLEGFPIDVPFFITFILLGVVDMLLVAL